MGLLVESELGLAFAGSSEAFAAVVVIHADQEMWSAAAGSGVVFPKTAGLPRDRRLSCTSDKACSLQCW